MVEHDRGGWMTVREITEEFKVHEETVRRWIRKEGLPAMLMGSAKGGYRVRRADLDRFLEGKVIWRGKVA